MGAELLCSPNVRLSIFNGYGVGMVLVMCAPSHATPPIIPIISKRLRYRSQRSAQYTQTKEHRQTARPVAIPVLHRFTIKKLKCK